AIACMALIDLRVAREWDGYPPGTVYVAFDNTLGRMARCDAKGTLTLQCIAGVGEECVLPGPGSQAWHLAFDDSGRFLAGKFHAPGDNDANVVILWDLHNKKKLLELPKSLGSITFTNDGGALAIGFPDNTIRLYSTTTGEETGTKWQLGVAPHHLSFHPSRPRLAVS